MSASLRDLGRRVEAVSPPEFDVAGIVGRGDSRMRHRRAALAAGVAAVVVATFVLADLLASSQSRTDGPVDDVRPPEPRVSSRSLTYTDDYRESWRPEPHWLIQSLHFGERSVGLEVDAEQMDVTDDGVVVVGDHGGVYFAEGATVERIGETEQQNLGASGRLDSGNSGSLVAWFTPAKPTASLVVYDTHQRTVVVERALPRCSAGCPLMGIVGERVYVDDPVDETAEPGPANRVLSLAVPNGEVTATDTRAFWNDLRSQPRALVKSDDPGSGEVVAVDARLAVRGDRLVLQWLAEADGSDGADVLAYGGYDTLGRPVDLRLPEGYTPTDSYRLFQWLDDDHVAVIGGLGDGSTPDVPHGHGYGGILVCDLNAERCQVAARGPDRQASHTAGGFRLVPDLDAPN